MAFASFMAMPKAPMNEDNSSLFLEYDIRLPRKRRVVKPIAESHRPQGSPDFHFRAGICAPDARHYL